eukprot:scaffold2636_cov340-Pavlova_lutheri.AAC.49
MPVRVVPIQEAARYRYGVRILVSVALSLFTFTPRTLRVVFVVDEKSHERSSRDRSAPFRTTPWLVLLPRSSARRNGSTFVAPPLLVLSCIAFVRRCFVLLRFRRTCCVLRCALSAVLPPSTASANLEAGLEEDAPPSSTQAPFPLASSRSDIVEVRDPRCARSAARPIEVNFVRVYEPGQGRTLSPSPGTSREFLLEEGREGGPPTACVGRARDGAHPRAS